MICGQKHKFIRSISKEGSKSDTVRKFVKTCTWFFLYCDLPWGTKTSHRSTVKGEESSVIGQCYCRPWAWNEYANFGQNNMWLVKKEFWFINEKFLHVYFSRYTFQLIQWPLLSFTAHLLLGTYLGTYFGKNVYCFILHQPLQLLNKLSDINLIILDSSTIHTINA